MQKKKRKARLFWMHDRRGTTLAELIAAMALNSLLMAATMFFLLQCIRVHHRILPHTAAIRLSECLLDQIDSALADADPKGEIVIHSQRNCSSVSFPDMHHHQVQISRTEDGKYLCIDYRTFGEESEETRWMLKEDLYQGFEVSELSFILLDQKNPAFRMFQAEMTITHQETGFSYSSVRYISCCSAVTEARLSYSAASSGTVP